MARGAVAEILRLPGPAGDSPRARTPSPAAALGAYAAGELGVLVLWSVAPARVAAHQRCCTARAGPCMLPDCSGQPRKHSARGKSFRLGKAHRRETRSCRPPHLSIVPRGRWHVGLYGFLLAKE